MNELLKLYQEYQKNILELEQEKMKLEKVGIDWTSKDSMTKLQTKLMIDNEQYKSVCTKLDAVKVDFDIVDKRISTYRSMSHLFKDVAQLETFINSF